MTGTDSADLLWERLERVRRTMLLLPHVTGVGVGWKEKSGEVTDIAAWRIYVRKKLALAELSPADVVPAQCESLSTDVVPACGAIACMHLTGAARLQPGVTISNLRGILQEQATGPHHSGMGTLGFFALVNGIRRREVVLVSNRHVLLAHGAGKGDPIYAPVFSRRGETCIVRASELDPVAEVTDTGAEQNHSFRYDGEPSDDYFVDCATARLLVAPVAQHIACGEAPIPVVRGVARMHRSMPWVTALRACARLEAPAA